MSKRSYHPKSVHELANLIDGGLRNIELVMLGLQSAVAEGQIPTNLADNISRLTTANHAMKQMASLIRQQMGRSYPMACSSDVHATFGQAVDHTVRLLTPAATTHNITVRVSISNAVALLPRDPAHTIVSNALRNSIQAIADSTRLTPTTASEPEIEIIAHRTDTHVELVVRDTGPGIGSSMFDSKGQFRFGQTTKTDGHGIGLPLIRDLVQRLNGTIRLENNTPRGASLTVRYPSQPFVSINEAQD